MPQIFKLPQIVKCRIFFRCRRTRNAKFETRNPKRETRNADDAADFLDAADLYFASAYFFKMPHIFVNAADFFKCRRFSFCFGRFSFGLFFSETDLRLVPQMTSKRLQRIDLVRHRRGSSAVLCLRDHCMVKCKRPDGHDLPIFWNDIEKSAPRTRAQTSTRPLLICEVRQHHSTMCRWLRMPLLQLHGTS